MEWPDYFPRLCPPKQASEINGRFYRLILGDVPKGRDFMPHYLLYPTIDWGDRRCEACGLTVFKTVNDCERLKKKVPSMRKRKTASGDLNDTMGKILNTPSKNSKSHHTWWLPVDLKEPWLLFEAN